MDQKPWVAGYGNGVTGPTTPSTAGCTCGEYLKKLADEDVNLHTIVSCELETIAIIPYPRGEVSQKSVADARTHLIAAAPELLRHLKSVLACIESSGQCLGDMQGMRNAIAKAESVESVDE